jgi:hypothetical protein
MLAFVLVFLGYEYFGVDSDGHDSSDFRIGEDLAGNIVRDIDVGQEEQQAVAQVLAELVID